MLAKPSADCFTPQWLSRLAPASFPYAAQAQLRGDLLIVLLLPFICEDSEERAGLFPADIDRAALVSQLNGGGCSLHPGRCELAIATPPRHEERVSSRNPHHAARNFFLYITLFPRVG